MSGVIGCWVTGFALVCVLAAVDCPFGVIGTVAVGTLLVSLAWGGAVEYRDRRRLREAAPKAPEALARRSLWTDLELDALDNDILLRDLLKATPVTRREGKYR